MRQHFAPVRSRLREMSKTAGAAAISIALHGLSMMPYRERRLGLRLLLALLKPLAMGQSNSEAAERLAKILALSPRDGRRFLFSKLVQNVTFLVEWAALGRRSVTGLIADARHLRTDDQAALRWLADQPGAIIGTMHFGPYSLAIVWLLYTYFQGRKVIIFKSENDTDVEHRAVARLAELGAHVEFVAPEALADFHRLIKEVRRGAIVIIMVDLPPAFGRSDELDLLGHRIAFASGATDLAALSQAPLMLLRARAAPGGDWIEIGDIFEVARNDPASRERAVSRIARFVSDTLRRYPDQWHMWERFGEYLPAATEKSA